MLTYFDDDNSLVINILDDDEIYELPNQTAITTATEILKKIIKSKFVSR